MSILTSVLSGSATTGSATDRIHRGLPAAVSRQTGARQTACPAAPSSACATPFEEAVIRFEPARVESNPQEAEMIVSDLVNKYLRCSTTTLSGVFHCW